MPFARIAGRGEDGQDILGPGIAHCRRPHCEHQRDLPVSLLIRLFTLDTTIGEIAAVLRTLSCSRCGLRGGRIRAQYVGPVGDGR